MNLVMTDFTNAKLEFLKEVENLPVKAATVQYKYNNGYSIDLKVGYSKEDYQAFLNKLDFNYDSGYGDQELFGTIWIEDGSWFDRGEYDGSEWWRYNSLPEIPDYLQT